MDISNQINLAIAIATAFSSVTSLAVVIASFKLLQATRESVEMMREQVRSTTRPYVQVGLSVRAGTTLINLCIRNAGATPAIGLRLSMDRDFYFDAEHQEGRNIRTYSAFSEVIASMPPKAELTFILGVGHRIFAAPDVCPHQFSVVAEYEFEDRRVSERNTIDLRPMMNAAAPIDPIAEQLKAIADQLKEIGKAVANPAKMA